MTETSTDASGVDRRAFVRKAAMGAAGIGALAATSGMAAPTPAAAAATGELVDAGVGMHVSMTTASMVSTATIGPHRVTCGVGTVGLDPSMVTSMLPLISKFVGSLPVLGGTTGPFAMLMYSTGIDSYDIDRAGGMLRAVGRMRSITQMAGMTLEDVEHDFVAVAKDGGDMGKDMFAVSMTSPFWNPSNPLATPSKDVKGWVMFGGNIAVGEVNVAP